MSGEVFSINFIRGEFWHSALKRIAVYVGFAYLTVNAVVLIWFLTSSLVSFTQRSALQMKFQDKVVSSGFSSDSFRADLDLLYTAAAKDLKELNSIVTIKKRRFLTSGKLAALAETLPARTWVNRIFSTRDRRTLKIEANYLIDLEKPNDLPVRGWMEALKADPRFNQGLKKFDMGASSRKTEGGNAELFAFELLAEW